MRKGLVTLGVVALVLAVSPGFAEAPILSCLPDITISDREQNSQTADLNLFIFSDALKLDEYVYDGDTPVDTLRWAAFDPSGSIEANGIMLNDAGVLDLLEPGGADLRQVSDMLTLRNAAWYGTDPGAGAATETLIEFNVSDGTSSGQATMKVMTVNAAMDVGDPDSLAGAELQNFDYGADEQGWTWFSITTPNIQPAGHAHTPGALTMTESPGHTTIIFGGWEGPKDPAVAVTPKLGCITRARYTLSSNQAVAANNPGIRLRGNTVHVMDLGGGVWEIDFLDINTSSEEYVQYGTIGFVMGGGNFDARVPTTDTEYTVLLYALQETDTLLSEEPIVQIFTCDLLDLEGAVENDSAQYSISSVVVDGIDCPSLGTGTAVAGFPVSNFSTGWNAGTKQLSTAPVRPDMASVGADLTITVNPTEGYFEAYCEHTAGVALTPGLYYRFAFSVSSTETASGDAGPTAQVAVNSSQFIWQASKVLKGGALFSNLRSAARIMDVWFVAPTEQASTPGATEPMKAAFKSFLESNAVAQFPYNRFVSGTITCSEIQAEAFQMTEKGLVPAP